MRGVDGKIEMTDVQWRTLQPILQDLADRIARIEQHLASTGFQVGGPASYGHGIESFDAAPASFGAQKSFSGTPVPSGPLVPQPGLANGVPADIVSLFLAGKRIQAIKQYRDRTGLGLKEAKDAVEQAAGWG